jgi:peroxiredoxin
MTPIAFWKACFTSFPTRCGHFWGLLLSLFLAGPLMAQNGTSLSTPSYNPLPADLTLVPQTLLGLFHAEEVQAELGLEQPLGTELFGQLQEIDGPWWRARNLPEGERRAVIAQQEGKLRDALSRVLPKDKLDRLWQLELQSQGARMLVRPEVAKFLNLDQAQQRQLSDLFQETERLFVEANRPENRDREASLKQAQAAKQQEAPAALKLLTTLQQQALPQLLGPRFDTTQLSRIYPLAPELVDAQVWVGDRRVSLSELRGQVVLLHFYAFQCHNCKANFKHYIRWQENLASRGVTVLGIQTPELDDERDPQLVSAAAKENGFQFPVLVDLKNANWDAWGNTMWPTVYVIDREGYIRLWWQGELNWQGATGDRTIEELVEKLLKQ